MKKFPNELYVRREIDGDESYLLCDDAIPEVNENTPLAIYRLVEVAELVVTREVKSQAVKRQNG